MYFLKYCTILDYFNIILLYASNPQHFRGKYCTFYSTIYIGELYSYFAYFHFAYENMIRLLVHCYGLNYHKVYEVVKHIEYFLHCVCGTFTKVKDLNISFTWATHNQDTGKAQS